MFSRFARTRPDLERIPDVALGELFAQVAAERGDAPALVGEAAPMSYAALEAASNQLARYLIARGVLPETVVALALPRSPAMIVALLAILKAGGAYLPLDPHHPAERLGFMIADSGARLLIANAAVIERLAGAGQPLPPLVLPEIDRAEIEHFPTGPLAPHERIAPDPASLAYVMYTSGSTGTPKGSDVTHGNIVNLAWRPSFAQIGPHDTLLQAGPVAFDAATFEIWGALLNGARLLLAPEGPMDLDRLGALMSKHRATIAWLTAGLFGEVAQHHLSLLAGLRHLLTGGDVLPVAAVARVRAAYPDLRLSNGYGPTETTTFACTHDIVAGEAERGPISIGRPIRNVTVHILDTDGVPVAPGVEGELFIAGAGVSRGYRQRPDLSAERFLPCPYGPPGALMYRTGDLARWRPDGAIDFLGRADGQIKLRGYRIELGEIEVALTSLPGIAQASVQARMIPQDMRLVAYLVAAQDISPPDASDLRSALMRTLPDHMIPHAFMLLDKLPLTANGKVDRHALPDPQPAKAGDRETARTAAQALLCRLFAEMTGTPDVAPDDDFFLIGGHSLSAMRLAAAIARGTGKTLPLGMIFKVRTPAGIAAALDGMAMAGDGPAMGQGWTAGTPRLSDAQRRHWLLDKLPGLDRAYIIPVAFDLTGPLDRDALAKALNDVIARHAPLHTAIVEQDGLPVARLIDPADRPCRLVVQHLSTASENEAEAIGEAFDAAAQQPFDLAAEPMLRAHLLRLGDERSVLLLQLHHGAADGESLPPLLADLATAYRARSAGAAPDFAPLAFDHADFAAWHEDWLERSGEGERQSRYWRERLVGFGHAPTIMPDLHPSLSDPRRAGTETRLLMPGVTAALADEARRHGTTPFALVLTTYASLVGHLANRRDIAIGVATAGRQQPGLADLVGCFANLLPVRLDLDLGPPGLAARISETRGAFEAMLAHVDLPFQRIVAEAGVPREPGRHPVCEATLSWLEHDPATMLALPGLTVAGHAVPPSHAKFDLSLTVQPAAQGGLSLQLDYDADRFSQGRAEHWADLLLDAIAALSRGDEDALAALTVEQGDAIAPPEPSRREPISRPVDPATLALITQVFAEITGAADPAPDEDFFLLGGNSLAANRLIANLKTRTGKRLPLDQFLQRPTIRGCAAALDAVDAGSTASNAIVLQPDGAGRPFFCVHGVDGNVLSMRHLVGHFGTTRPFIGLRALPDDPAGEPVETIAARYLAAIRTHQPHGPYLIGGYSFGGAVAFEIARMLRDAGETIELLAIVDASWPGWRPSRRSAPASLRFWLANVPHIVRDEISIASRRHIAKKLRNFGRLLARLAGAPRPVLLADVVNPDRIAIEERPRLQGRLDALAAYRPAPCPLPVALFRARAPAALTVFGDATYAWRETAEGSVAVHIVPGNHVSMMRSPINAERLAVMLNAALDAADPPSQS